MKEIEVARIADMEFAAAVARVRGHRTREQFAGELGCSIQTLRRAENEGKRPRTAAIVRELEKQFRRAGVPVGVVRNPLPHEDRNGGRAA